jgi:SAM-dependent methyltransferase
MTIKSRILRKIISSSFFWEIRHLFQPDWIEHYDTAHKDISFIINFVKDNNIKSVLDFGCASGSTLKKLKKFDQNILVYGVDINKKAIDYCNKKFKNIFKDGFFFASKLRKDEIQEFLNKSNINRFDIIIFDRVLYCLDDKSIFDVLDVIGESSYIFIDDFYKNENIKNFGYLHRNWDEILNYYSFQKKIDIGTIYSSVDSANARSMIFKKEEKII